MNFEAKIHFLQSLPSGFSQQVEFQSPVLPLNTLQGYFEEEEDHIFLAYAWQRANHLLYVIGVYDLPPSSRLMLKEIFNNFQHPEIFKPLIQRLKQIYH